jgi:hypothetical protein
LRRCRRRISAGCVVSVDPTVRDVARRLQRNSKILSVFVVPVIFGGTRVPDELQLRRVTTFRHPLSLSLFSFLSLFFQTARACGPKRHASQRNPCTYQIVSRHRRTPRTADLSVRRHVTVSLFGRAPWPSSSSRIALSHLVFDTQLGRGDATSPPRGKKRRGIASPALTDPECLASRPTHQTD